MSAQQSAILVDREIIVNAPQGHVFDVFANKMDSWWPRTHHLGTVEPFTAHLEPQVGGRWYERGEDGSECLWGRVLEWNPTISFTISWLISDDFKPDPNGGSQVTVNFEAVDDRTTRVRLLHHNLEVFGDKAAHMAEILGAEGGWVGIMDLFKAEAEK